MTLWLRGWGAALKRDKYLYLLMTPGLLFFLIFKYGPMWGLSLAFQNYSPFLGFWKSEWVGFKYFSDFLTNPDFFKLLRNTLAISFLNILFFFPAPIVLALMLNEVRRVKFKKFVQTAIYLPHFVSWVVIAGICFILLSKSSGVVNGLIVEAGGSKIDFLTNENTFWLLLTSQSIWKDAGYGTIIFLAALTSINPEQYEAAQIDGASRWKQLLYITLPGLKSTIVVLLILRLGTVMDVGFEQVYLMNSAPVESVGDMFDTYAYRVGVQQGRFSFAIAAGMFKSIVGFIMVVAANRLAKKMGEEGVY
ncbi:ABC transporter permease subunit [Paenibacillus filicis]|uniref:ABC transporter permease subunit n=1 Tax=Paenibacillus gyeongsangnamensis TaxID=3388067 RepID=A0ABT4Q238_9BACL|nr:ABC transporter permease subunit [Paenibacillus filicis]MCZ8510945.1 ABC transporter permease subunit [Paenibacillus filicis]